MIRVQFDITTNSGGAFSETEPPSSSGPYFLEAVEWIDGTLADGVDAVLSISALSGVDKALLTLTNANDDAWYYPRVIADGVTGSDLTGWYAKQIVDGPLKLAVTDGGNVASGKCIVYLSK